MKTVIFNYITSHEYMFRLFRRVVVSVFVAILVGMLITAHTVKAQGMDPAAMQMMQQQQAATMPMMPTGIPGGAVYGPVQGVAEQPAYVANGAMGCGVGRYQGTVLRDVNGQVVPGPVVPVGHQ